jgi:predicted ATPase/DNA-binding SARP family transcriptional activator
MAHLSVLLLGPFQATLDGHVVTGFESATVRALLAYLAAEAERAHTREAVAELLWPERPPGVALADLRHALANLRKVIADPAATPPTLLITPTTLQFNLASAVTVDLHRFTALLQPASLTPAAAQTALALRLGAFLDGFTLPHSPQFEEWLVVMAERVDQLTMRALTHLAGDCTARRDFAQAAHWLREQFKLEPWNEEIHQQLIWQLALSGQPAAALRHYDICRRLLEKELGVTPQPATEALVARIRSGEFGATEVASDPPPVAVTSAAPPVVKLPPRPLSFLGRTAELETVADLLANPDCRLVTILGPGGMGKTFLAIAAAHAQTGHFPDGVCFVDLAPVATPDQLPGAILRALDLPLVAPEAALERLDDFLRESAMLLVLDNFEHLVEGAAQLTPLLQAAPGLKLLVTSRARLHLREEWLLTLEGLATPPVSAAGSPPPVLADYSSLRLFVQRLRQIDSAFQPAPADLEQIAAICRLLEGMPLGIELAAGWGRSLSLAEIAAAVRDRLDLFTTPLRDLPARHRSMHAVFDQSWRLLNERERSLLRQLAVCRGGCTLATATAIAGATLPELEDLIDQSWLRVQGSRFTLHELMRQFCAEKLAQEHAHATGEPAAAVYRRHCLYFAGATGAEESALNWKSDSMTFFRAEFGNLDAAWRWAVEHGELDATRQMMNSLFFFAEMTGWSAAMLPYFEDAAVVMRARWQRAADAALRQESALVLVSLLYIQQTLCRHLSWYDRCRAALDEMAAVLATMDHDDAWRERDFWRRWNETLLQMSLGDFAGANAALHDLLAFVRTTDQVFWPWRAEIGNRFWVMHFQSALGTTEILLGNYERAWQHNVAAVQACDATGEQRFKAHILQDRADLLRFTGDYDGAREAARAGLALSEQLGDASASARAELSFAWIENAAGQYALGEQHARRSLAFGQETGELFPLLCSLTALACSARQLGDFAAAHHWLDQASAHCRRPRVTHVNHLSVIHLERGHLAAAEAEWALARQHYQAAAAHVGCIAADVQEAHYGLARVAWAERDCAEAQRLLSGVIDHPATEAAIRERARRLQQRWELWDVLAGLAADPAVM